MAYSSILGAEVAPTQPSGRDSDALGPSDNSDSGSDAVGTAESYADSDSVGTGERASVTPGEQREGGDILPDRVIDLQGGDVTVADGLDADELADLDESDVEGDEDADPS